MRTNAAMDILLAQPELDPAGELGNFSKVIVQPIRRYYTSKGSPYYLSGQGENPFVPCRLPLKKLMEYEWNRNETRVDGSTAVESAKLALALAKVWESVLTTAFPNVSFTIVGSVDYGEDVACPSATLRFWAQRPGAAPMGALEDFGQPVFLIELIAGVEKLS